MDTEIMSGWLSSYSMRTVKSYKRNINEYLLFCERNAIDINNASYDQVNEYKEECKKGLSVASVANRISTISSYYDYLECVGVLKNNPVRLIEKSDLKVIPYSTTPFLDAKSIKSILDAIDIDTVSGSRDNAILILMFFNGIKASDVLTLKFKHFIEKPDGDYLSITKKEEFEEEIKLSSYFSSALDDYLLQDCRDILSEDSYVFVRSRVDMNGEKSPEEARKQKPLTSRAFAMNLAGYAKSAGVSGVSLRAIHQSSAYYQYRFGKSDDDIRYFMNHTKTISTRRFIRQCEKRDEKVKDVKSIIE